MSTAARGHRMLTRMKQIESTLPFVEDAIHVKRSFIDFAYETGMASISFFSHLLKFNLALLKSGIDNDIALEGQISDGSLSISGCHWHTDISSMENPVSCWDLPQFMIDSYEECRGPPRLFLLDKYDRAGSGACLKRYSDPGYFRKAWEAKEPDKAVLIQREKKNQEIKNSLGSSAQFLSVNNDGQSFTTENSSISETRFEPDALNLSPLLKLKRSKQIPEACPSAMPDDLEHDLSSISNLGKNQEGSVQNEEIVFSVDDDSHDDFMLRKSTSRSPSVIWDEKSEILKDECYEVYDDTVLNRDQGAEPFLSNSKSLEVCKEPAQPGSLGRAKKISIVAVSPASLCGQKRLDEVTSDADNYLDALNTLESEGESESDCQTKVEVHSRFSIGPYESDSGVAKVPQADGYSGAESPTALSGSAVKLVLPEDSNFDVLKTLEHKLPKQVVGFSTKSCYIGNQFQKCNVLDRSRSKKADGDQSSFYNDPTLETMRNNETAEAIPYFEVPSLVNVPSHALWTNGNLLGLEPSKPPAISLSSGARESSQLNCLNYGFKQEKANGTNRQLSEQLISEVKAQETCEILISTDQRTFNSDQLNSRRNTIEEINLKHSLPCLDHQLEGIPSNDYCQEQSEVSPLSVREGAQTASSSISTNRIDQMHYPDANAFDTVAESCCTSHVASQWMESAKNTVGMSAYSGLAHKFLVHGLQRKPSVNHLSDSVLFEQMDVTSQSQGKSPVHKHRKRSNGVSLQAFYEQSFIGKANCGSLKRLNSSSPPFENSSPPMEYMKISFHPMNSLATSSWKPEFPDCNVKELIDGMALPSFQVLSGCTHLVQDGNPESDDDTFCRSYPYSSEDLLSLQSDSNSELWEQDDMCGSNVNEQPDDLRRISSLTASISSSRVFEQNHVDQVGLKDYCTENDLVSFQSGHFIDIPDLDSFALFRGHRKKIDSLSINSENFKKLPPTEQPPPPPLPPIQWRKLKPSNEVLEERDSDAGKFVDHFEGLNGQTPPTSLESEKGKQRPPSLGDVRTIKKLDIEQQPKPFESRSKANSSKEVDEMGGMLHQIRNKHRGVIRDVVEWTKPKWETCKSSTMEVGCSQDLRRGFKSPGKEQAFNLRRTSTSRPSFVPQPTTNVNVAVILEKANAIRQNIDAPNVGWVTVARMGSSDHPFVESDDPIIKMQ
ncbi:SCAR-like protein 2 [Apostasia shenzhenica]|uniref:Protein SCAR n=1 Tax=Apostasia shenzhenica TaxID=1088818 RepID=A0A2I0ATQ0_9ASPA|nr:SCAR-like protein 2 [Apostasia shenzhenica]